MAWGHFERQIIASHRFITAQSRWVEAWVRSINGECKLFHTELPLRPAFYCAQPWQPSKELRVFCMVAYPVPFKGIHDAIRAIELLNKRIPSVRLRIAGALQNKGVRQDGYINWINQLSANLGINEQIDWLGPLTAEQISNELQECSVMLMPSHCESYGVAQAEAMYLGVPIVTASTGGSAWLAQDEHSALFYPPGDEAMCAWQIERLLKDQDLSKLISENARTIAIKRNDPSKIVANQIEIYREIIAESRGEKA
jgi:glycosyltransferase involved in cell wall biosynthesis